MPEPSVFSVGEFLDVISELLSTQSVAVQGEVVGAKNHPTGFYFSLKDPKDNALMDCYVSPYVYRGMGVIVEDGMQIKVGGMPSIYKPKGRFSFRVDTLEPVGEGSLKKAYEALKQKLMLEGLFERKRPLPECITAIGLVTSKTGAVIDDFRRNLAQLGLTVYHRDVRVEGAAAVGQVAEAIVAFDRGTQAIDVLVIIRGGGSMEDLQAFNNELVARAVFGSRVPTIVSIGHDRDVPLAQMVADASGSTPTATAMLINGSWDRLRTVDAQADMLAYAMERVLGAVQSRMEAAWHRLDGFAQRTLERFRHTIDVAQRIIESANPERQLKLGYSIVTDASGAIIRAATQLRHGQTVTTRLAKGSFISDVKELQSD